MRLVVVSVYLVNNNTPTRSVNITLVFFKYVFGLMSSVDYCVGCIPVMWSISPF